MGRGWCLEGEGKWWPEVGTVIPATNTCRHGRSGGDDEGGFRASSGKGQCYVSQADKWETKSVLDQLRDR